MATRPESALLTYADYVVLLDDGKRYEILEGELAATPSPDVAHQSSSGDRIARGDETLIAQPFPGLAIPLAKLWR